MMEYERVDADLEYEPDLHDLSDLPTAVIVTNVPVAIFKENSQERSEFECLFSGLSPSVSFEYFRSFKRVRVGLGSPEAATAARLQMDQRVLFEHRLSCFFAQTIEQESTSSGLLKLPPLEKQFLISPPASPPVGWAQCPEAQPVLNFELMARLATLSTEEQQTQIHEATESGPAIIIHPCEDQPQEQFLKPKIKQTRRPPE